MKQLSAVDTFQMKMLHAGAVLLCILVAGALSPFDHVLADEPL